MDIQLKCLLKALTGYDCPFCGAQRALDALIHGDIIGFYNYNPYLVIISPYLILIILSIIGIIPKGSQLQRFLYNQWVILIAGLITISWWVLRNMV